jgi:hypothetical protein
LVSRKNRKYYIIHPFNMNKALCVYNSSIFEIHDAILLNIFYIISMILFRHVNGQQNKSVNRKKREKKIALFFLLCQYTNQHFDYKIQFVFHLCSYFFLFFFYFIFRFNINYKFFNITNESTIHNK